MKAILIKVAFVLSEICFEIASCYIWIYLLNRTDIDEQFFFVQDLGRHLIQSLLDAAWTGVVGHYATSSLERRIEALTLLRVVRIEACRTSNRYVTICL